MSNEHLQGKIADFSGRLDQNLVAGHGGNDSTREITYARVAKIAEEAGELSASLLRFNGHNVLKEDGTVTAQKVSHDLLSVALTALAVYEHWTGNQGNALDALEDRMDLLSESLERYSKG